MITHTSKKRTKKMNTKRISGLVIFLIGLALVIFGLYAKGRQASARSDAGFVTNNPFGKNQVTETVGGIVEGKISQYNQPIFWCLVGGIVLIVVGGGILICSRKKR